MKARGLASPAKLQTQEEEMHIKYWDSIAETYVTHEGTIVRSGAGYGAGPENMQCYIGLMTAAIWGAYVIRIAATS
jgi:hypothetical protein